MTFEEYRSYDALGLAQLVSKKEVLPSELMDLAFSRIETINPQINAVIYKSIEYARNAIKNLPPTGIFRGVPILIKDLGLEIKDYPLWNGSRGFEGIKGKEDSFIIQNLKKEGLIIIGRSHSPEFGLKPVSDSRLWGNSLNPWRNDLDPGGSSGGSAAAISSGIVPIASGSDVGGSIRIPASCCGLFGFKPSRSRVSLGKLYGEIAGGAMVEHCLSRSVRDSAAYLEIVSGYQAGELNLRKELKPNFHTLINTPPKKLRIGFSTKSVLGNNVHEECVNAVNFTIKTLKELGHEVEEVPIPYQKEAMTEAHLSLVFCETAAIIKKLEKSLGRKTKWSEIELDTRVIGAIGSLFSATDYILQKDSWNYFAREMGVFHKKYDVLLTPTLSLPHLKVNEFGLGKYEELAMKLISKLQLEKIFKNLIISKIQKGFEKLPFTSIANITGQPSMNVPLYWTTEQLPVGVMFTGAIGSELLLFKLAKQLEESVPWFDKIPLMSSFGAD